MAKVPVNLTIEEGVIEKFKEACERVGLSTSGVIEVFMRSMLSTEATNRMEVMCQLVEAMRKEVFGKR